MGLDWYGVALLLILMVGGALVAQQFGLIPTGSAPGTDINVTVGSGAWDPSWNATVVNIVSGLNLTGGNCTWQDAWNSVVDGLIGSYNVTWNNSWNSTVMDIVNGGSISWKDTWNSTVTDIVLNHAFSSLNATNLNIAEQLWWNGLNRTDTLAYPYAPYSYEIGVNGTNYYMKNGTTGKLDFWSINSSAVFSNVIGNSSSGGTVSIKTGTYTVNSMWYIPEGKNDIRLNFEKGAKLVLGNNVNLSVIFIVGDNCIVDGVTIDGNAAQNDLGLVWASDWNGYNMATCGVYLWGSNCLVENSVIYNCGEYGVMVYSSVVNDSVHSGVINSKIYDCGWNGLFDGAGGLTHDRGAFFINNEVYGEIGDVGIDIEGRNGIIQNNFVHDINGTKGGGGNSHWGIAVEACEGALIANNVVTNCNVGINPYQSNRLTITGNKITYCNFSIYINDVTNSLVTDNFVAFNDPLQQYTGAIMVNAGSSNITISDNMIYSNYAIAYGIQIQGHDCNVMTNTVQELAGGNSYGIIVSASVNGTTIFGNRLWAGQGVNIGATAYNTFVSENNFMGCTTSVSNSTAYIVGNNLWKTGTYGTTPG